MKLKTAIILIIITCVLGVTHYNEQITISITLPSLAQVVDAAGKAINELKKLTTTDYINIETYDNNQNSTSISNENCVNKSTDIYRIRSSWDNVKSRVANIQQSRMQLVIALRNTMFSTKLERSYITHL